MSNENTLNSESILPDRNEVINHLNQKAGWIKEKQWIARACIGPIGGPQMQYAKDLLDESLDLLDELHIAFINWVSIGGSNE